MSQVIAQASSVTSPTSNTIGTTVEVPLPDTIPIIFIPGIMGSNVCTKEDKIPVWRLANGLPSLFWNNVLEQRKKSPAQLQTELNPQTTEVDRNGPMGGIACNIDRKILRKRGWGTVHWDSYGGILVYLQQQLNKVQLKQKPLNYYEKQPTLEWQQILQANEQSQWGAISALKKITEADLEHLQDFNFPVHAMGYNWLQSNEEGAKNIAQQLDEIKQEYGSRFHKFIIVTHSMGGLLTRRLVQLKEAA